MKRKQIATVLLGMMIGALLFGSVTIAAPAVPKAVIKQIAATFSGIKISVNGKTVQTNLEPFLYNNTTYLPVRVVAEALDKEVAWDSANNAVVIKDKAGAASAAEVQALKTQLAIKEQELLNLRQQLAAMEKKMNAAKELVAYLDDEYGTWERMSLDFEATGTADALDLTIKVNMSKEKTDWGKASETKKKQLLNDIYNYVKTQYQPTSFTGKIIDTSKTTNNTLVTFKLASGKLTITFNNTSDFYGLKDDLQTYYGNLRGRYNTLGIDFTIELDGDEEDIEVLISFDYFDDTDNEDTWDNLTDSEIKGWLQDIVDEILDVYEDASITGSIVDEYEGDDIVTFDVSSSTGRITNFKRYF